MDVRALILEACDRALISQAELARRAGSSPSALSAWLTGRVSPTVASLTRVLAAADLQVRVTLEPLLADLDARVDEVLAAVPVVDVQALEAFLAKVPVEHRWPVEGEDGSLTYLTGPISWAFDGTTALALHGLAFSQDALSICMAWDDATRSWLTKGLMTSTVESRQSFWGMDLELAERYLGAGPLVGALGMFSIRPVEQLPTVVRVQPADGARSLPVVSLDAVEAAHPALGEVLARLRSRRGGTAA